MFDFMWIRCCYQVRLIHIYCNRLLLQMKSGHSPPQTATQKPLIKLKPKRPDQSDTRSLQNNEKSAISTNQILSSISTKLNPKSISVSSSDRRWSGITTQKIEIKVSCLDQLRVPKFYLGDIYNTLDFEELRRKAVKKKVRNLVVPLKCVGKGKKLCSDANCFLKEKWKNKLVLQIKQSKQAQNLKNLILSGKLPTTYDSQIQKDISRSFPSCEQNKPKLTLYHRTSQKQQLQQNLLTVLKMLSITDTDVGYIQGINLFTGVILSHTKQIELSYMFTKQVMKYGNMRKMYVNNFKQIRQLCYHMLHRHVKILMFDLYDMFDRVGIFVEIFMPYYLSMFACVVDYQFMHTVIDQFMAKGFFFLDKLLLAMLCYIKHDLLASDPVEITCKLGASYIRSCQLPWDEIINLTQTFELN